MQIAVLSDIHGNSWALECVLADIKKRGIRRIYDLGDSLQGPLNPGGTFELMQEWQIPSLRGNQERFLLEELETPKGNATLQYVLGELNQEALCWLRDLPTERVFDDLYLCHGSPDSDSEYLLEQIHTDHVGIKSPELLLSQIKNLKQKIILCGHSHTPRIIEIAGKIIINPGSVGLPAYDDELPLPHKIENHSPKTRYAILDIADELNIEQVVLNYDYESAARCAEKNQRPDWAGWLRSGRA